MTTRWNKIQAQLAAVKLGKSLAGKLSNGHWTVLEISSHIAVMIITSCEIVSHSEQVYV